MVSQGINLTPGLFSTSDGDYILTEYVVACAGHRVAGSAIFGLSDPSGYCGQR